MVEPWEPSWKGGPSHRRALPLDTLTIQPSPAACIAGRAAGARSSGSARLWDGPPFQLGSQGSTITVYGASKAALNKVTNGLAAELHGTGIRVNTVEPRAAVLSEGAAELVGGTLRPDQIESMEAMVEGVMYVCDCPADFTGNITVSLDLIEQHGLTVHGLDGAPQ